jgi:hypothetical protein
MIYSIIIFTQKTKVMERNTLILTKNGTKLLVDKIYGTVYLCFVLDGNNKKIEQDSYTQKYEMGICSFSNVKETYTFKGN